MSKPVIWIPRRLSDATLERARRDYEVIVNENDTPGSAEDIVAMSARVDGMIPCHSEHFTADVVARLDPRLRIVANHSVGVDHCDLDALKSRGIVVTNTPDVLSDATAEIAMLLMLGAARHAVRGDRLVRQGQWDSWSPSFMVGKQVTGARLGIVCYGSTVYAIDEARAHLAQAGHPTARMRLRALPIDDEVVDYLGRYERIVVIEMNRDGQLAGILRAERPELAARLHSVAHLDGLPFSAEQIEAWLAPHLDATEVDA